MPKIGEINSSLKPFVDGNWFLLCRLSSILFSTCVLTKSLVLSLHERIEMAGDLFATICEIIGLCGYEILICC